LISDLFDRIAKSPRDCMLNRSAKQRDTKSPNV
jgi:hypothetical protein